MGTFPTEESPETCNSLASINTEGSRVNTADRRQHPHGRAQGGRPKKKHKHKSPDVPKKPPFTPDLIKGGLSQLGKTADGLRPAYLRLDITHGTDMANTRELAGFPDLQILVLANNELTDLSHLSHLPNLIHLDVSNNKLTEVLNFKILEGHHSNLRHADFSGNRITTLPDLSAFSRLTSLALDRNEIEVLHGLGGLSALNTLSLTHNRLRSIEGLEALVSLRHLNLQGNRLRSLEPLSHLKGLQTLDVSCNLLSHLEGVQGLEDLQQLDVTHNLLPGLSVTDPCARLAFLYCLHIMKGNPLAKVMGCRLHLVHLLPQVAELDGAAVLPKEKVLAANMHGAAAEGLLAIRRKYFPRGELNDNGGTIPPPSAGLVASDAKEEAMDLAATRSAFLRIDACVGGMDLPPAQCQGAAAMLESLVAQTAAAAAAATTPNETPSPSRMATPLGFADTAAPAQATASSAAAPEHAHSPARDAAAAAARASVGRGAPMSVPPNGAALVCLAAELASVCEGQLQLARACLQWVAMHTLAPQGPGASMSVDAPLFAMGAKELLLLGYGDAAITGTWAERAAWLFVQLARACELEAVIISGFWKGDGIVRPGRPIAAHNHCWAGVKVNGQWRLLDPTVASLHNGRDTPSAPFYVPPAAFIYAYFPLEDHWQLLPEPMPLAHWWSLPHVSVGFQARGMKLLEALDLAHLGSVNTLPAPREGTELPVLQIRLAAPAATGTHLRHSLRDAATRRVVFAGPPRQCSSGNSRRRSVQGGGESGGHGGGARAAGGVQAEGAVPLGALTGSELQGAVLWPPPMCGSRGSARAAEMEVAAQGALAFQQVEQVSVDSSPASHTVCFGPLSFICSPYSLAASPPGPGEYELVVEHVLEVPGGLPVQLQGMDEPLVLRLEEAEEVLSIKVVVPEVEPHPPEDGILHDTATRPCLLPFTHQAFIDCRAQLVSPLPTQQLLADRTYAFQAVVPGAQQVALLLPDGQVLQQLTKPGSPASHQPQQQPSPRRISSTAGSRRGSFGVHGYGRGEHPELWCAEVRAPRAPFLRLAMARGLDTLAAAAAAVASVPRGDVPRGDVPRGDVPRGDAPSPDSLQYSRGASPHQPGNASRASSQADAAEEGAAGASPSQDTATAHAQAAGAAGRCQSADGGGGGEETAWVPLLTFHVGGQLQHMVGLDLQPEVPTIEPSQPSARVALEAFSKMDLDQDGQVSRKDMLAAVRKDTELACLMGLPHSISLADGSMDRFYQTFLEIDTSGLGVFSFSELCAWLGIRPESSFGRAAEYQDLPSGYEEEEEEEDDDDSSTTM